MKGNVRGSRKRVGSQGLVAIARIDDVVIGLFFVLAREVWTSERRIGWGGDVEFGRSLSAAAHGLRQVLRGFDLPRSLVRRFHPDVVNRDLLRALVQQRGLNAERLAGDRDVECRSGRAEDVTSLRGVIR